MRYLLFAFIKGACITFYALACVRAAPNVRTLGSIITADSAERFAFVNHKYIEVQPSAVMYALSNVHCELLWMQTIPVIINASSMREHIK